MRITKQKVSENRERVIEEAARLFRQRGFGVGVAELMAAAGLTHGGFYNHFDTKDDLEAATCARIFDASVARMRAVADDKAFADYSERYVSAKARDASAATCPMVAFAGDVSRRSASVRQAYGEGLAAYLVAFTQASGRSRPEALRLFATLLGALTLARSVAASNPDLSEEILAAAREG